jgi:hypothetical protein
VIEIGSSADRRDRRLFEATPEPMASSTTSFTISAKLRPLSPPVCDAAPPWAALM